MAKVAKLTEQGPVELVDGVRMFPFWGEGVMMNLVDLDPNAVVPLHSHLHEQMGIVLTGQITMHIDGADHPLDPDGCRVLDIVQPVRDDYVERAQAG